MGREREFPRNQLQLEAVSPAQAEEGRELCSRANWELELINREREIGRVEQPDADYPPSCLNQAKVKVLGPEDRQWMCQPLEQRTGQTGWKAGTMERAQQSSASYTVDRDSIWCRRNEFGDYGKKMSSQLKINSTWGINKCFKWTYLT